MSAPVDVLAVMDREARQAWEWRFRNEDRAAAHAAFEKAKEARAAVAELMDDVQDFLTDTANGLGPDPERLHAALARCGVVK